MKPFPLADLDHVLEYAPMEELRGARLFITGGTGFFGRWLLESLCHANARLNLEARAVVLSRDPLAFRNLAPHLADNPALSFVAGDVRDFAFPTGEFWGVIHAATEASATLNVNAPLEMFDVCAQGTRRTLEFAARSGVRRFLLASSGAVYGVQPPMLSHVPETYFGAPDTQFPASAYGEGKRVSEWLSSTYGTTHGFEAVTARAWAFVGPALPLDAHFAIGNFLRDALDGGPIRIGGDGTPMRSYLHAADLSVWLWTLLLRGQGGRAYNVGSDEAISIEETARRVASHCSPIPEITIAKTPPAGVLPSRYVPSIDRARAELGLEVRIGLDNAIERTLAWLRT